MEDTKTTAGTIARLPEQELDVLDNMGTAARLRSFRIRAGKSKVQAIAHLGLNAAWYDDLERNDDELASTLTLFQAMELALFLGVPLSELVNGVKPKRSIPLLEVPGLIKARLEGEKISMQEFEALVGWELGDFIESPISVTAERPILFVQVLGKHLGIDWLYLVPEADAD